MRLEALIQMMRGITGEKDVNPWLNVIAHWTRKIKKAGSYTTSDTEEIKSLKKISELKIIEVTGDKEMTAQLTKEGEELSKDFFMQGFYAQEG